MRPRPGRLFLQMPRERKVRIDNPVLLISSAPMEDAPNLTLLNQLPGELDGGTAAVIVIYIMFDAGLLSCVEHFLRLGNRQCHWLFTEDVLPSLGRRCRHFAVQVLRKRYIYDVYVIAHHNLAPICFDLLPPPSLGEFAECFLFAAAGHFQDRLTFDFKKPARLKPSVRMSFAHKAIANDRYAQLLTHIWGTFSVS